MDACPSTDSAVVDELSKALDNSGDDTEIDEAIKTADTSVGSQQLSTSNDDATPANSAVKRSKTARNKKRAKRVCRPNKLSDAEPLEAEQTQNGTASVKQTETAPETNGVEKANEEVANENGNVDKAASTTPQEIMVTDSSNASAPEEPEKKVTVDETKLNRFLDTLVEATDRVGVEPLERLYWALFRVIQKYTSTWDRSDLPKVTNEQNNL